MSFISSGKWKEIPEKLVKVPNEKYSITEEKRTWTPESPKLIDQKGITTKKNKEIGTSITNPRN